MKAFHDSIDIKNKYVNRVLEHFKADEIIKGKYWQNGKGCAVGCTIHSSSHLSYETELGIPLWLAIVEDRIFEGLPNQHAKEFPSKFLAAIHPGANLDKIKAPFLIFILESTLDKFDHKKYPKVKESVDKVIELYKNPNSTLEEFKSARSAYTSAASAYAAYAYAAYAAYAASAAAATAYAYAAYIYASADAAASAADAAASAAAKQNTYVNFADKLLELLAACKP